MTSRIRLLLASSMFLGALAIGVALTEVQAQPGGKKGGKGGAPAETADSFVGKVMAFNKAKDGKLTKAELTDTRLLALFERADANKDGIVTRDELLALYTREQSTAGGGGFGEKGKGKGGKDGFGEKGKGDKGKGGPPPQPGVVLPPFVQDALNLTEAQRRQIADLQKDIDTRLEGILTEAQRLQLREMRKGFGDKKGPPGGKKGEPK